MQTQTQLERDQLLEQKVQKVKDLYADAPELGRAALEKGLPDLTRDGGSDRKGNCRVGARQGKVSELTGILPIAEGGAKQLRGLLQLLEGNFKGADVVGTLHDMRFAARESAIFGQFEPAFGVIPGAGGAQHLARLMGRARALEVMLSAQDYDADLAATYG